MSFTMGEVTVAKLSKKIYHILFLAGQIAVSDDFFDARLTICQKNRIFVRFLYEKIIKPHIIQWQH